MEPNHDCSMWEAHHREADVPDHLLAGDGSERLSIGLWRGTSVRRGKPRHEYPADHLGARRWVLDLTPQGVDLRQKIRF